jgi:hypothetical protein
MDDVTIWMRAVQNLIDRVSGPMHFRFILQPVMASIFAVIAGLRDAKANRPPYLWSLISDASHRADMVKSGWKSVGKVDYCRIGSRPRLPGHRVALRVSR